jgi:hypothetical protein
MPTELKSGSLLFEARGVMATDPIGNHTGLENPVWVVYDKLRSASLNVKYYGTKLQWAQWTTTTVEVILALAASSTLGGLTIWKSTGAQALWTGLSATAAVLAVLKPLLGSTKKIRDLEALVLGYRLLYHDLQDLRNTIAQDRKYGGAQRKRFEKLSDKERELISRSREAKPNKRLQRRFTNEVINELPVESFYLPPEDPPVHERP